MKNFVTFLLLITIWIPLYAGDPPPPDFSNPFQRLLMQVTPLLEAKTRHRFTLPRDLYNETTLLDNELQNSILRANFRGLYGITFPVKWNSLLNRYEASFNSEYERCLIVPLRAIQSSPSLHKKATIAHELFHCYQMEIMGAGEILTRPEWLIEGSALWVGESLVERGTELSHNHWRDYLGTRMEFTSRGYDAFGFFWFLQKINVNNYSLIKRLLPIRGSDEMWEEMESFLTREQKARWAPGLLQDGSVAADADDLWNFRAPQMPVGSIGSYPQSTELVTSLPATYTIEERRTPRIIQLFIPENKTIKFNFTNLLGAVRVKHLGHTEFNTLITNNGQNFKLCYGEDCGCPGHQPSIDTTKISVQLLTIAVYSPSGGGKITLEEDKQKCCEHPLGIKMEHLLGTWQLDQEDFLNTTYAARNLEKTAIGIGGNNSFTIYPSGLVVKTYQNLYWWLSWNPPLTWREDHYISGSFRACLSLKLHSTGTDLGDVYHATLTQYVPSIFYYGNNSSGLSEHQYREPFYFNWGLYNADGTEELNDVFTLKDGVLDWRSKYRR
ncbi:MAG: hypothetical protein HQK52_08325 [Oligoflexia bacterium]|nr:hypothetical protein [Oligoflexia bacterium]